MRTLRRHIHTRPILFCLLVTAAITFPALNRRTTTNAAQAGDAPKADARPVAYRSRGARHKLRVTDARQARELAARGGRLLADYDGFQLVEVDAKTAEAAERDGVGEWRDEENLLLLNAGALDTAQPEIQARRAVADADDEHTLHLVQFAGPVKPEWHAALTQTGVEVIAYIPHNAYLVHGDAKALARLRMWAARASFVQWDGAYRAQFKLDPTVAALLAAKTQPTQERDELFAVQLVAGDPANIVTLQLINALKTENVRLQYGVLRYLNLIVRLPLAAVEKQLAARPDVISIARYVVPVKHDERQNAILAGNPPGGVPDYLGYLVGQGFTQNQFDASGSVVNVSDSGIDNATQSPNHFALYAGGNNDNASRIVYNRLEGTPNADSTLQGCDGHGNLNAHILAGYVPSGAPFNAFPHSDGAARYGLGVAPFVRLGSSVVFDPNSWTFPNFVSLEARAYNDGARISSNSWGASVFGAYGIDAQTYDALVRDAQPVGSPFAAPGNQEQVIVFSAGNQGPIAGSVGSPGTAKNVLTVGAAESVRTLGGTDACQITDAQADNAGDIAGFSGRGPTLDGRNKPDVVAPGTHVTGGVFQNVPKPPGNGQAAPCYVGGGVCGGPAGAAFFPAGQQFYTSSSGTSVAVPAAAGAAALLRQRFSNVGLTPPSPAMTKAVLMNSARYLTGAEANDNLWSQRQGMGEVNLDAAFSLTGANGIVRDQLAADTFTATGQMRSFTGGVSDNTKPLRVTLAWTDAPGSTAGNAFVNNLDLEVIAGGVTYRGNVFSGALSATGGVADQRNNVESVYLPASLAGTFAVRVRATNIAGDGVPNSGGPLDQDFALVVTNAMTVAQPVVTADAPTITAENCLPANNAVDPGETVTVNLTLQNAGAANTGNLVATLTPTSGVVNPSTAQTYGALPAGGAAVTRPFSFTAMGVCGGTLTATLTLQDGALNLGAVSFNFTLGATVNTTLTFQQTTPLIIPAGAPAVTVGTASTYPSTINVGGLTGSVSKVTVTLNNVSHTHPDDLDLLLVGPAGQRVVLLSDAGGASDLANVTLTFDDAAGPLPNATQIAAGTYAPTNYDGGDTFPAPAPAGPYADPPRLSAFNGANPNGVWSLYALDDGDEDTGGIGGWSLAIRTTTTVCCMTGCPAITVAPTTIAEGTVGTPYNQVFTQTGGAGTIVFNLVGTLPAGLSFTAAGVLSGTPQVSGTFPLTVTALDANNCIGSRPYTLVIGQVALQFFPLPRPIRLLDTRPGGPCDNLSAPIPAGTALTTQARITCEGVTIPATAQAIVGNLTVLNPGAQFGFATVYPSGQPLPLAANIIYEPGQIISNSFTVGLNAGGLFDIYGERTINAVVDISGYFAPPATGGLYYHALPRPVRLLDTRANQGNCDNLAAPIPAGTALTAQARVTCEGITIPAAAQAVVANATAINGSAQFGFLTIYPNGVPLPLAANLIYAPGGIIANAFTVGLSATGAFDIFAERTINVVVDVAGYYSPEATDANGPGLLFRPLPRPLRLLDTRAGGPCDNLSAPIPAGTALTTQARVTCEGITIPGATQAIVGNVTVINPGTQAGFITIHPSGVTLPLAANMVYFPGQILSNAFVTGLSATGQFNLFAERTIDAVVDVAGFFAP